MKLKKLFAIAGIAALSTATLASCGGEEKPTTDNNKPSSNEPAAGDSLTVWGPAAQQEVLKKLKTEFLKENPNFKLDIKFGIMDEPKVLPQIQKDVTKCADVYAFPQNELENLIAANGLSKLGPKSIETINSINKPALVKAATAGNGGIYGYPETADNGYFLFYDKSVLSTTDVASFETLLAKASQLHKNVVIDMGNAFYSAGFFFGTGCKFKVEYDDKQKEKSVDIDFNNANGLAAAKAMIQISEYTGKGFLPGGDNEVKAGFGDNSVIAAVSGVWNAKDIKGILKENLGACKLPTFTVDGKTYQMGSFSGSKLVGVNPTSKHVSEAHQFASYITSEKAQEIRFDMTGVGPSATKVQNLAKVQEDPTLSALFAQNEFATPEVSVPSTFWPNVAAFSGACCTDDAAKRITVANAQEKLNEMVNKIKAVIKEEA